MFCSEYKLLIIICLVLGLLLISSDFSSLADTSNACFNLASARGLPEQYFSILTVSSYLAIAPLPVSVVGLKVQPTSFHRPYLSVVLSTGSRRPEFLRRAVLGCTDFPHLFRRDYPAALFLNKLYTKIYILVYL